MKIIENYYCVLLQKFVTVFFDSRCQVNSVGLWWRKENIPLTSIRTIILNICYLFPQSQSVVVGLKIRSGVYVSLSNLYTDSQSKMNKETSPATTAYSSDETGRHWEKEVCRYEGSVCTIWFFFYGTSYSKESVLTVVIWISHFFAEILSNFRLDWGRIYIL